MHFPPSLPFLSIGPVILLRIGSPSATLATGTLSVQTYDKGVLKLKGISLLSLLHDSWLAKDLACFRVSAEEGSFPCYVQFISDQNKHEGC